MSNEYAIKVIMQVVKQDGRKENVSFDKILRRIEILCTRLALTRVDAVEVAKDTINGLYNGITTEEIDHFASAICAEKIRDDPQYDKLATGLCISRLHKNTSKDFLVVTNRLYENGDKGHLVTKEYLDYVTFHIDKIQAALNYMRDYDFDYFGIKTLERAYLFRTRSDTPIDNTIVKNTQTGKKLKLDTKKEQIIQKKFGTIVERPQHLFMRVAIALNMDNLDHALETYELMSQRYFIFGSPTLYNAGSCWPQLSSCYLLKMDDSLDAIFELINEVAQISKRAGGIGISISDIRAHGSAIRGTNGHSDGIIPMIQVLNQVGRYVNQSGRRNGAIAVYIEPWHADVFPFCELRKNTGAEEMRARDIFLALWIPDLFMKRVQDDALWSLMCPDECPGLTKVYGEEFTKLYEKYEASGKYRKQIRAKELWFHILSMQIESGMPYMLYKDNINRQSNQMNIGVIQSSNLCSEIVEYSDSNEIAVCNLSSLCLPRFVEDNHYNYDKLRYVAQVATRNLNKVIDINYYPSDKAKQSNFKHRPIGVGVQGLADVYCMLDVPFDSEEARVINRKIFETIYFGCLTESNNLAKIYGPYETFWHNGGCPFSKGLLQYHLWGHESDYLLTDNDWDGLISSIKKYGTRNSLLTTAMPTASTSQLMSNSEAIEPITQNIYTRTTLAGEFVVINKYLVERLIKLGLWNKETQNELMYDKGSIQNISTIPDHIKAVYKTAFEMKTKPIVQQSIERGPFIDQTQSLNLFCKIPDFEMLTSAQFYGWKNKIKTGMYYLRTQPAVDPIEFGMDQEIIDAIELKRGNKKGGGKNGEGRIKICWM